MFLSNLYGRIKYKKGTLIILVYFSNCSVIPALTPKYLARAHTLYTLVVK